MNTYFICSRSCCVGFWPSLPVARGDVQAACVCDPNIAFASEGVHSLTIAYHHESCRNTVKARHVHRLQSYEGHERTVVAFDPPFGCKCKEPSVLPRKIICQGKGRRVERGKEIQKAGDASALVQPPKAASGGRASTCRQCGRWDGWGGNCCAIFIFATRWCSL